MKEFNIFSEKNLTEKVHYVYRVTIDDKYYIGKRSGFLNDLITGVYKTSSKLVHEKLQNGLHFSKIKILQIFSSPKDALNFEKRILTRLNAKTNKKFLNQCNGNDGNDFCLKQHTEKTKKKMSEIQSKLWDKNTEEGRKNREIRKNLTLKQFDISTEKGRKNREKAKERAKVATQKSAKTRIQKRKNISILGELMFDEDFIRENFLITDNKNNQRFLWSVYSKLTGYSECFTRQQKQNGKISFLSGIKSIKLSEEDENTKIKEIEQLLKSRNNEKE